jgi:hypothetical protein
MTLPSVIVASLDRIATELYETTAERGHNVDTALETDPAFGSGRSRSSLLRDLVIATIDIAASVDQHADFRPVNGAGRELRFGLDEVDRRFRVVRGPRTAHGELRVPVNGESTLTTEPPSRSLFGFEQWAFIWEAGSNCIVHSAHAARVVDVVFGHPGYMVLADVLHLGGSSDGGGFPTARFGGGGDDDLDRYIDEFFDDEDRDEGIA